MNYDNLCACFLKSWAELSCADMEKLITLEMPINYTVVRWGVGSTAPRVFLVLFITRIFSSAPTVGTLWQLIIDQEIKRPHPLKILIFFLSPLLASCILWCWWCVKLNIVNTEGLTEKLHFHQLMGSICNSKGLLVWHTCLFCFGYYSPIFIRQDYYLASLVFFYPC